MDAPNFRGRPIGPRTTPEDIYKTPERPYRRSESKVTYLPQSKVVPPLDDLPSLNVSVFPIHLIVTGTNSGDNIDLTTQKISSESNSNSMNYRQYILQLIRPRGGDVVKLVPEPDNPFDALAVKVLVEFEGNWVCVGYIPSKPKEMPGISFLCNKDILDLLAEKPLYTTGWVTYKDGSSILGYRITIKDHIL